MSEAIPFVMRLFRFSESRSRAESRTRDFVTRNVPRNDDQKRTTPWFFPQACYLEKEISTTILIIRNEQFIVPAGGTVLQAGDSILALVNKENLPRVRGVLSEVAGQDARA